MRKMHDAQLKLNLDNDGIFKISIPSENLFGIPLKIA